MGRDLQQHNMQDYWQYLDDSVLETTRTLESILKQQGFEGIVQFRYCTEYAIQLSQNIDFLILINARDKAILLAHEVNKLASRAIDVRENPTSPKGMGRDHALAWNYRARYLSDWLLNDNEDKDTLEKALEFAHRALEKARKIGSKNKVRSPLRTTMYLAGMAGHFVVAEELILEDLGRQTLDPSSDIIYQIDHLVKSILGCLTGRRSSTLDQNQVIASLHRFFSLWRGKSENKACGTPPVSLHDGIEVSYLATKFVDEFRLEKFTRWNAVQRLRYPPGEGPG